MANERTKCPTCGSVVEIGGKPEATRYFIPVIDEEVRRLKDLHSQIFDVYVAIESRENLDAINRAVMEMGRLAAQGKA